MRAFALVVGFGCALTGCVQHSVVLKPEDATRVVEEYARDGKVEVPYGRRTVTLERKDEPSLEVREGMFFGDIDQAPLDRVKVDGNMLVFESGTEPRRIDPRESYEVRLEFGRYHPPDEELMLGVGVAVAGPTVYSAPFFDVRFTKVIAVEAGAFAVTDVVWGHVGFRLVPVQRKTLRPFIGAFAHGASYRHEDANNAAVMYANRNEDPTRRISAVGPRLGVDWVLNSGHYAIRTEFDVVHRLSSTWLFGIESEWLPWGGVSAIAYE